MINPKYKFFLFIAALAMMFSGCLYRPDIQQGNELDDEMIASISLGMTQDEVADILGKPLITDPFNRNRWDYYYFLKDGKTGSVTRRALFIEFVDDKVSHFKESAPTSQSESAPEEDAADS